ncbi:hypothetical protein UPYG_G00152140 [Umbra pygmaea]|uniref:Apolipoprotein C-II n=1 Tax=Umbra pygmaea TaxID=75934 RepID=A0ABD0WXF6_UMBPY
MLHYERRRRGQTSDIMNKLLVITVLVTLLGLNAHGFRLARQADEAAPEDEETGTLQMVNSAFKQYYETCVNTASGWLENLKDLKLNEKAKTVYTDTSKVVGTYAGIFQDQVYHIIYPH